MKLTFRSPYLSITALPEVELPEFTVLTGLNGSGKTHLMQSIAAGNISASVVKNPKADARYYDWVSLTPNNADNYDSHGRSQQTAQAYAVFNNLRSQHQVPILQLISSSALTDHGISDVREAAEMSTERLTSVLGDPAAAESLRDKMDAALNGIWRNIRGQVPHNQQFIQKVVDSLQQQNQRNLFGVDQEIFSDAIDPTWGQAEPFRQAFSQLFGAYRDLLVENRLRRLAYEDGETNVRPLADQDFYAKYNQPPWVFLNKTLAESGLDFSVDKPSLHSYGPYRAVLRKNASGREVQFGSLSSGEKVLMSFALCVYYAQDRRQLSRYPPLLLLDEVDAPLHPSMCRQLVNTIINVLIQTCGLHVILATHSPTTVAIAPEESIHVMRNDGSGIEKTSKSAALNILTCGVPTVSLDFEGRRQVVVESARDARLYERIYRQIKSKLNSERSLEFIGVGKTPNDGSGCSQVMHIVESLTKSGNKTVFGLVDWDNANVEGNRIFVLAAKRRYSLENCLLDPLLVAILIMRDAPTFLPSKGLDQISSYLWFKDRNTAELQQVVDGIANHVLPQARDGSKVPLEYMGGMKLLVDRRYLTVRGHDLERRLIEVFPPLNRNAGEAGRLMGYVVESVCLDYPEYIPSDFNRCFTKILAYPSAPEEPVR